VPVKKGCIPDAPDGEHRTQAGTLPAGATTAVPDGAPVVACGDDADRAVPAVDGVVTVDVVVWVEVIPVAAPPVDTLVPEAPVVGAGDAAVVDCVGAAGLVAAGETKAPGVPVPRVTTPFGVTLPGGAAV
jgi:hypothetical protein